ncbi:MAG: gliding motility-associated C-terminal domain-containing protein, partial [Bacteroidales bacterium]|nr:gliding motility-associated C-terminal domain-containing protein [Bacteroidales bacterium]
KCIKVKNAFTPNNDSYTDTWEILDPVNNVKLAESPDYYERYKNVVVKVYNRWGNMVWMSQRGYPVEWDGVANNKILPVDTYYYIIEFNDGSGIIEKGDVTIIHDRKR